MSLAKSSVDCAMAYQRRRRFRVRAAFFAAAERERAERCLAARFARRDSAFLNAIRNLHQSHSATLATALSCLRGFLCCGRT